MVERLGELKPDASGRRAAVDYLPVRCSICQASRQRAASRLFNQSNKTAWESLSIPRSLVDRIEVLPGRARGHCEIILVAAVGFEPTTFKL
jgi:hypothetical protein